MNLNQLVLQRSTALECLFIKALKINPHGRLILMDGLYINMQLVLVLGVVFFFGMKFAFVLIGKKQ